MLTPKISNNLYELQVNLIIAYNYERVKPYNKYVIRLIKCN